jgi:hypothetical protein
MIFSFPQKSQSKKSAKSYIPRIQTKDIKIHKGRQRNTHPNDNNPTEKDERRSERKAPMTETKSQRKRQRQSKVQKTKVATAVVGGGAVLDPPHCAGEISVEGAEGSDAGVERHSAHGGGNAGARVVVAVARRIVSTGAIARQMCVVDGGV